MIVVSNKIVNVIHQRKERLRREAEEKEAEKKKKCLGSDEGNS